MPKFKPGDRIFVPGSNAGIFKVIRIKFADRNDIYDYVLEQEITHTEHCLFGPYIDVDFILYRVYNKTWHELNEV